jgi:hypothetical protein
MNLLERVKGIILNPKNEWNAIQSEQTTTSDVLKSYLIPLALISVIASFIGFGLIGRTSVIGVHSASLVYGLKYAIIMLLNIIISVYLASLVINELAPAFSAVKNYNNAFRLVVYSYTPMLVAGALYILPVLSILVFLASIYGLYLLYLGLKPMMQVPDDKAAVYFIVSIIVQIAAYFIIATILSSIIIRTGFSTIRTF